MTKLEVELFGLARRLAGTKEVDIHLRDNDTYRDVAAHLVLEYPALLGQVIEPGTYNLVAPHFFNVDARRVVRNLDEIPEKGKPLLLLYLDAGGI